MEDSSSQSFFRRHWEGYKEFWSERFSILDNYSPFIQRQAPLPPWSSSDVEEFIASDPVHGPVVISSFFYCLLLTSLLSLTVSYNLVCFLDRCMVGFVDFSVSWIPHLNWPLRANISNLRFILRFVYLKLNVFIYIFVRRLGNRVVSPLSFGIIWNFLARWLLMNNGLSYNILCRVSSPSPCHAVLLWNYLKEIMSQALYFSSFLVNS